MLPEWKANPWISLAYCIVLIFYILLSEMINNMLTTRKIMQTGVGQHIDIAMIDATIATDDQMHYDLEG